MLSGRRTPVFGARLPRAVQTVNEVQTALRRRSCRARTPARLGPRLRGRLRHVRFMGAGSPRLETCVEAHTILSKASPTSGARCEPRGSKLLARWRCRLRGCPCAPDMRNPVCRVLLLLCCCCSPLLLCSPPSREAGPPTPRAVAQQSAAPTAHTPPAGATRRVVCGVPRVRLHSSTARGYLSRR